MGLAGCLADGSGRPTDRPSDSPTDESPTADEPVSSTPTDDPSPGDPAFGFEVLQFAARLAAPEWWQSDGDTPGHVELFASARAARDALDFSAVDENRLDAVESFVDDTDFFRSRLLFVESVGPNTCYSKLAVEDLTVDGDELVGTAAAVDPSEGTPACGQAITFPSALVRVTFPGRPLNRARITIESGLGDRGEVSASAAVSVADLPGFVRPPNDPSAVPPKLVCENDDFRRLGAGFDQSALAWGETPRDGDPRFALRVDQRTVARGDTVTVALTNVTNSGQVTGNRQKYNLQVKTEAGWQDVRGATAGDPIGYTDEGVGHEPGGGFQWRIRMTESGVIAGHALSDHLTVCPGLPAGRYRFVFWEPAVAVAFDLEE